MPEDVIVNAIPLISNLKNPTIKEICKAIGAEVLFGEDLMNNQSTSFKVGAMQLENYLNFLEQDSLIITPGDRSDIILGALQANISRNYPKISGIVLTGGLTPEPSITKLIEGLKFIVPILSVKEGTFEVANKIGNMRTHMYAENDEKILLAINTFEKYCEVEKLSDKLISFKHEGITPRMFQYNLLKRAKTKRRHIVLPEGEDDRIVVAASRLSLMDFVDLTLLGNEDKIKESATRLGVKLNSDQLKIVNTLSSPHLEDFANTLFELRKHKGMTIDIAEDLIRDVSYFGTMMVYKGMADGMVSGAVHTTQHTIKPALQFVKMKPGVSVVSSVFFMCLQDRVSVFGDCAINPNPNAEQLAEIAISSAESSQAFGIEPRIAMLSYSSGSSGKEKMLIK
jgi:phosphate acetyltransferase